MTCRSRVFDLLGITPEEAQDKFGFLLEAFKYGAAAARRHRASAGTGSACCWPATDSIREVIAFPKTRGGFDPLTGAPTPITAQQRLEAGIDAKPKPAPAAAHRHGRPGSPGGRPRLTPSRAVDHEVDGPTLRRVAR